MFCVVITSAVVTGSVMLRLAVKN